MTKQFDLIHLPEGAVAVDKNSLIESNIPIGSQVYDDQCGGIFKRVFGDGLRKGHHKIIAASPSLKLEGIPLLPDFNDPLNRRKEIFMVQNMKGGEKGNITFDVQLFEDLEEAKEWCKGMDHLNIQSQWIVAAQAKQYSREDLQRAYYRKEIAKFKDETFDEFEASLSVTKLPIAVVLEMNDNSYMGAFLEGEDGMEYLPDSIKTDAQGYVIIKEYVYEGA